MLSIRNIVAALAAVTLVQGHMTRKSSSKLAKRQAPPTTIPDGSSGYLPVHALTACQGKNYGGSCLSFNVVDTLCQELPSAYNDKVASFRATDQSTTTCVFYADPNCSGHSWTVPSAGSSDVVGSGGFGSNGVTTIQCTSGANSLPPVNAVLAHSAWICKHNFDQCTYQTVQTNTCSEIADSTYQNQVTSFQPPSGTTCQLYSDWLCAGTQTTVPWSGAILTNPNVVTFKCFSASS